MSPTAPVRRPTIKEVAKLAGVSFKTVARVVNNEPSVTAERREAVRKAMAMLNYAPNVSARQLASKRSYLMALLFGGGGLDNFARAQMGAIRRCREAGYHLIVEEAPPGSETEVATRLFNSRVDGVVVLPPLSFHPPMLEALRERGLRHALITVRDDRSPGAVDEALGRLGLTRRIALRVPNFLAAPLIVAETDLILTLPRRLAHWLAGRADVQVVEPPLELGTFSITQLWHERRHDDPEHAWLRATLASAIAPMG